jgi:hypothetical protein
MSFVVLLRSKEVKARKQYKCNLSGKIIKKGELYNCQVNVYDGEIYDFRTCKEADYLAQALDMYGKGTDNDGFCDSDYEELLMDYVTDNGLYEEYEEYDGLLHDFVFAHYTKIKEVKE